MVVNTTNIYSESRKILKELIDNNVIDPKIGTTISRRRWIYREEPDTTSRDFAGYPIIVIRSPDVGDEVITLNQQFRDDSFTFEIEIYAEFNDKDARVDSISDSVISAIMKSDSQDTLATNKLFNPNLESSPFTSVDENNKQLSARLIRVNFSSELCW